MRVMPVLAFVLASASCKKDAEETRKQAVDSCEQSCEERRNRDRLYYDDLLDACMRDRGLTDAPPVQDCAMPVPELDATYVVGIGDRVVLTNRKPIGDRVRWFRKGDDCRLDPGGTMTVLDVRKAGDELGHWIEYLVRYARAPETSEYSIAPERDAEPYQCPTGATFYHEDPLFIAENPSPQTAGNP